MKRFILFLSLAVSGNCLAQPGDESLQIDTAQLLTPCDCHAAVILNMKEAIFILEEFKRLGKEEAHLAWAKEEMKKRDVKHHEVFMRCMPIYNEKGRGSDCENNAEGERLNAKLIALNAEVKLYMP